MNIKSALICLLVVSTSVIGDDNKKDTFECELDPELCLVSPLGPGSGGTGGPDDPEEPPPSAKKDDSEKK